MAEEKSLQELCDDYRKAKEQLAKMEEVLFPKIKEICETCGLLAGGDRITDFHFNEEPTMLDEPEVAVNVHNWGRGLDTYFFPKRYLEMTIDGIKADIEEGNF